MLGLVAALTAGSLHVMACSARRGDVPCEVVRASADCRNDLGSAGGGALLVEDAGLDECLIAHVVSDGGVALRTLEIPRVCRVGSPRNRDTHTLMTSLAAFVGDDRGFRHREGGLIGDVLPQLTECDELVGYPWSDTRIHMAIHTRDIGVRPFGPGLVVRAHLVTAHTEGWLVGCLSDTNQHADEKHRRCDDPHDRRSGRLQVP
jgi:hypothetical protein